MSYPVQCPRCGHVGCYLTTPDYGYGYGAEYACFSCNPYGHRFSTNQLPADERAAAVSHSNESRALSRANADSRRASPVPETGPENGGKP